MVRLVGAEALTSGPRIASLTSSCQTVGGISTASLSGLVLSTKLVVPIFRKWQQRTRIGSSVSCRLSEDRCYVEVLRFLNIQRALTRWLARDFRESLRPTSSRKTITETSMRESFVVTSTGSLIAACTAFTRTGQRANSLVLLRKNVVALWRSLRTKLVGECQFWPVRPKPT